MASKRSKRRDFLALLFIFFNILIHASSSCFLQAFNEETAGNLQPVV